MYAIASTSKKCDVQAQRATLPANMAAEKAFQDTSSALDGPGFLGRLLTATSSTSHHCQIPNELMWCVDTGSHIHAFRTSDLGRALHSGTVLPTHLIWREGLECWAPAKDIKELAWVLTHREEETDALKETAIYHRLPHHPIRSVFQKPWFSRAAIALGLASGVLLMASLAMGKSSSKIVRTLETAQLAQTAISIRDIPPNTRVSSVHDPGQFRRRRGATQ